MHQYQDARETRAELVAALGTEADRGHWMIFMQSVTRLLPDVLSSGRPTRAAIERSAIGQLGFESWAEMVEAPIEAGGLGWNMSAWKAWRRAWAVVQANPWMLEQSLSSSEVNSLANECRQAGVPIPGSAAELATLRQRRQLEQQAQRSSELVDLTNRLRELEGQLAVAQRESISARSEARGLTVAMEQAISRAGTAEQLAAQRLQDVESLSGQVASLKRQLERGVGTAEPVRLTRWQHLMAAIFGDRI